MHSKTAGWIEAKLGMEIPWDLGMVIGYMVMASVTSNGLQRPKKRPECPFLHEGGLQSKNLIK